MSLQDDYFDVRSTLEGKSELEAFERIWFAFCDLETKDMVRDGQLSEDDYRKWREAQLATLSGTVS